MNRPPFHISAGDNAPSNWDPIQEESSALQTAATLGPIFEAVKAKLPVGTTFALAIGVPPVRAGEEGRVVVISTDRKQMARLIAQWLINSDALR